MIKYLKINTLKQLSNYFFKTIRQKEESSPWLTQTKYQFYPNCIQTPNFKSSQTQINLPLLILKAFKNKF